MNQLAEAISAQDWNFGNADTGYLTHGIHRYSGKFIPQIAGTAIQLLSEPGDLILDPYCGSGTTLLEAARLGRRAIGVDMNPLAVLIARVKTTPVEQGLLAAMLEQFSKVIESLSGDTLFSGHPRKCDKEDPRLANPWFTKWFQPEVLKDLVVIRNEISELNDPRLRDVALASFSNVLRRSSNAHQGYPNVMFDKRGGDRPRPGPLFLKSLRKMVAAVASLPAEFSWEHIRVDEGDARDLNIADDSVEAVITHPPYVGSVPYAEYGALSLTWLGYDPKELDGRLTGGKRQSRHVLSRFTSDYLSMMSEAHRVLKPHGKLFVLVGNPTIKGEVIDLASMTEQHAQSVGFTKLAHQVRTGENRRANKMGKETLLVFVKS